MPLLGWEMVVTHTAKAPGGPCPLTGPAVSARGQRGAGKAQRSRRLLLALAAGMVVLLSKSSGCRPGDPGSSSFWVPSSLFSPPVAVKPGCGSVGFFLIFHFFPFSLKGFLSPFFLSPSLLSCRRLRTGDGDVPPAPQLHPQP